MEKFIREWKVTDMWDRGHRDQCEVELAYVDEKFSKSTTFLGFFTRSVMRVVILWLILDWISIHKKVLALMRGLHKPLAKRGWFISIWVNLLLLYFLSVSSFLSSSHISIIFVLFLLCRLILLLMEIQVTFKISWDLELTVFLCSAAFSII